MLTLSRKNMSGYFNQDKFRQALALVIILGLFVFLLISLQNFINAFLGAVIFYVLFKPLMQRLVNTNKWNKSLAATLIIFISFLLVIVPVSTFGYILFSKVGSVINDPTSLLQGIRQFDSRIMEKTGVDLFSESNLKKLQDAASNLVPGILNSALQIISNIIMMYFILFYLLVNTGKIENEIKSYLPFSKENTQLFSSELNSMTLSNVIAVPLVAACQGIVASIGFAIFGLHQPFFWGMLCGCFSIIPVVGAGIIWVPAGVFMLGLGEMWQGIAILVYGVLVISTVDNVFRFLFQKKFADVHPVITIFGVIIGLNWFGIPGLVFGPLLISYFLIMLKIYRNEYLESK